MKSYVTKRRTKRQRLPAQYKTVHAPSHPNVSSEPTDDPLCGAIEDVWVTVHKKKELPIARPGVAIKCRGCIAELRRQAQWLNQLLLMGYTVRMPGRGPRRGPKADPRQLHLGRGGTDAPEHSQTAAAAARAARGAHRRPAR